MATTGDDRRYTSVHRSAEWQYSAVAPVLRLSKLTTTDITHCGKPESLQKSSESFAMRQITSVEEISGFPRSVQKEEA